MSEWIGVQRGMTLTGENGSTRRKTCQSSTLSSQQSGTDWPEIELSPAPWDAG